MPFPLRRPVSVAIALAATAVTATVFAASAPATSDKEKTSYAIGMQLGAQLKGIRDELDLGAVSRGLVAMASGAKTDMTVPEAKAQLETFGKRMQARQQAEQQSAAKKNLAEGNAFFAANGKKPGVKTTASGLQYQVIKMGTGPKPKKTDAVKVNYVGQLLNGTTFDASAQHGGPAIMQVNEVIPGWTEGLQLMPVGSKFIFWIPGKLAYGDRGTPGGPIGPDAALKFEVELISIGRK